VCGRTIALESYAESAGLIWLGMLIAWKVLKYNEVLKGGAREREVMER
jgi:hypothetical protein